VGDNACEAASPNPPPLKVRSRILPARLIRRRDTLAVTRQSLGRASLMDHQFTAARLCHRSRVAVGVSLRRCLLPGHPRCAPRKRQLDPRVLAGFRLSLNARWFPHCGGNAPIDCILLLYVIYKRRLRVWMSDAEHTQRDRPAAVSIDDLLLTAKNMFTSLYRELNTDKTLQAAVSAAPSSGGTSDGTRETRRAARDEPFLPTVTSSSLASAQPVAGVW